MYDKIAILCLNSFSVLATSGCAVSAALNRKRTGSMSLRRHLLVVLIRRQQLVVVGAGLDILTLIIQPLP